MIENLADNVATFYLTGCLSMSLLSAMLAGAYVAVISLALATRCKHKYPKIS
jgi:hypothetical protein